jgi:hypothetical protein
MRLDSAVRPHLIAKTNPARNTTGRPADNQWHRDATTRPACSAWPLECSRNMHRFRFAKERLIGAECCLRWRASGVRCSCRQSGGMRCWVATASRVVLMIIGQWAAPSSPTGAVEGSWKAQELAAMSDARHEMLVWCHFRPQIVLVSSTNTT